jgi:hypothetical protein
MKYVCIDELQWLVDGDLSQESIFFSTLRINNILYDKMVFTIHSSQMEKDIEEYVAFMRWDQDNICVVHTPLNKEHTKVLIIMKSWVDLVTLFARTKKLKAFL